MNLPASDFKEPLREIEVTAHNDSMVSGVNHITLAVPDLEKSFEFYTKVLGMKPLAKRRGQSAYLLAGADWVVLVQMKAGDSPAKSYAHLAFSVESEEFVTLAKRIREAGAEIWQDNSSPGDSLYFLDPGGNRLEIHTDDWRRRMEWLRANPSPAVEIWD